MFENGGNGMGLPEVETTLNGQKRVASFASLDDSDLLRMRSASSFGWYDESTQLDTPDTSSFMQIRDWREIDGDDNNPAQTWSWFGKGGAGGGSSFTLDQEQGRTGNGNHMSGNDDGAVGAAAAAAAAAAVAAGAGADNREGDKGQGSKKRKGWRGVGGVAMHINNEQFVTTTKTFYSNKAEPVPYAVAIGAIRVLDGRGGGHAQYEVVLSTNTHITRCWKRFSNFKLLAEYAKMSDMVRTVDAWATITEKQRFFRCLEANYLRTKCYLLEKFLAQLLFDLPTPSLLLTFVQAPISTFMREAS